MFGSCQSRGSAEGERRRCRPSPSPGAPEGVPGHSRAVRGTSCSRHPENQHVTSVFKWFCEVKTGVFFRRLSFQGVRRGFYLPVGVVVLLQGAGVGSRQHNQAAVLPVHLLHGGPGADDLVCWTEGEVVQVLVHWVPRRLFA